MAQNEMKAMPALPERVRSMEGLGLSPRATDLDTLNLDALEQTATKPSYRCARA